MTNPPGTKNTRRQLHKERRRAAAAAAAAKRRRQQAMLGGLAGLAVIGVIVAVFLLVRGGGSDGGTATPAAGASASASAGAPSAAAFPALPPGADPALSSKPQVAAGTGDVTTLKVTPIVEGTGAAAQNGQTVTVNYVGVTYADGKEFDASWDKQQTFDVTLGAGGVIKGWEAGLLGAKVGSRLQLDIPSDQAYGDSPPEGYPKGDLRFVVDVLAVR
jgi:peptidylprolyl isomerase